MDPTVQVACIGIVTAGIATLGAIVVAFINSRRPHDSGAAKVERELRDRIDQLQSENLELRLELLVLKGKS